MTGGGTAVPGRCVSATANHATAKPTTMLPASPMKVRCRPRRGHGRLKNRKPASAPASTIRILAAFASPIVQAKPVSTSTMPSTRLPARPSRPSSMLIALTTASAANTVSGMAQWRVLIGLVPKRSPRLTRKFSPQDVISSAARTCSSSFVPGETSPRSSIRPTRASRSTPAKKALYCANAENDTTSARTMPAVTASPPVSGTGAAWRLRPPGWSTRPQRSAGRRSMRMSRPARNAAAAACAR